MENVTICREKMSVKYSLDFHMTTFEERGSSDNVIFYHFVKYIRLVKFTWKMCEMHV
jgi:hypothetical protein